MDYLSVNHPDSPFVSNDDKLHPSEGSQCGSLIEVYHEDGSTSMPYVKWIMERGKIILLKFPEWFDEGYKEDVLVTIKSYPEEANYLKFNR